MKDKIIINNREYTTLHMKTHLIPYFDVSNMSRVLRIKGNLWDNDCPVFFDVNEPEGFQCKYLHIEKDGEGPVHVMDFRIEITGKWNYDIKNKEYSATCLIVVPSNNSNQVEVSTFSGKVWVEPIFYSN